MKYTVRLLRCMQLNAAFVTIGTNQVCFMQEAIPCHP